jgi:hypothetical protein
MFAERTTWQRLRSRTNVRGLLRWSLLASPFHVHCAPVVAQQEVSNRHRWLHELPRDRDQHGHGEIGSAFDPGEVAAANAALSRELNLRKPLAPSSDANRAADLFAERAPLTPRSGPTRSSPPSAPAG